MIETKLFKDLCKLMQNHPGWDNMAVESQALMIKFQTFIANHLAENEKKD